MSSPLPLPATSPIEVTSGKLQRRKKRSRKDAAMQVRESGWATTSVSMSRSWNSYNAFEDPHCPWALALKHNLHGSRRSAALLNGKTVGDAKIKADHGVKETILSMTEPLTLDRWSLPTMPKTQKKSDIGSREGRQNTASSRASSRGSRRGRRGQNEAPDSVSQKVGKAPLRGGAGLPSWEDVYGADNVRSDTAVQNAAMNSGLKVPAAVPQQEETGEEQGGQKYPGKKRTDHNNNNNNNKKKNKEPTLSDGTSVYESANAFPLNVSWQESISGGAERAAEVELTCLRCVVRREALLADLATALGLRVVGGATTNLRTTTVLSTTADPPPETVLYGLFSSLREVAIEVTEAIIAWQRSPTVGAGGATNSGSALVKEEARIGTANRTFMYRHENYLLKMVSDTDFLDDSAAAKAALGKIGVKMLRGNPFLMPTELARRVKVLQNSITQEEKELALKFLVDPLRLRDAERIVLNEARRLAVILDEKEAMRMQRKEEKEAKDRELELTRAKTPQLEPLQEDKRQSGVTFIGDNVYVNPRNDEFTNRTATFSDRGAGDKNASKYGGNSNYERSWTVRPPALEDKLVDRLKDLKLEVADRQQGIGELATELVLKRTAVGRLEETISVLTYQVKLAREANANKKARSIATRIKVAGADLEVANKDLREARATLCLEELEVRRVMALVRTINQQLKDERERKRLERERRAEERRMKREKAAAIIQRRIRGVLVRKRTLPRILERRAAAEEIRRIAKEKQLRDEAKAEVNRRRALRDAAVQIQKIARGMLIRTGLQARAEAAAEAKAMAAAAAEVSATAAAAAAEARATALALQKDGCEPEAAAAAERLAIADEDIADAASLKLEEGQNILRSVQNRSPLETLEAKHRKTPSPGPSPKASYGENLPVRFAATPVGQASPPATPVLPGSRGSRESKRQVFGARNVRALTPEVKEGMKRKIENALGNPRLYKYYITSAIENKLPTDAGLRNSEKQLLSVESAEHSMFIDRIATPLDTTRSRPTTIDHESTSKEMGEGTTSMASLFAPPENEEGNDAEVVDFTQLSTLSGRIVTPILEVKIDPAVAGRISSIDEATASLAGEAAETDLRLRLSSSFIASSNELWWTVDVIDKADLTDEAASRMYRVDMRPWQLAENGLDEITTIAELESNEERNILVDKLLVFLVNQQRNISRQQQRQVAKHLKKVGEESSKKLKEMERNSIAEKPTRKVWNQMFDPSTGYMYYVNEISGLCQWTTPSQAELDEMYSPIGRAVAARTKLDNVSKEEERAKKADPKVRAAAKEDEAAAERERHEFAKRIVELENPQRNLIAVDEAALQDPSVADPRSLLQQLATERQRREEIERALKEAENATAEVQLPIQPWDCGICKRRNTAGVGKCGTCGAAPGRIPKPSSTEVADEIAKAKSEADELRKALAVHKLQSDTARAVEKAAADAAQGVERSVHTAEHRRSHSPLKSPEYAAMRDGLERLQRDLRQQEKPRSASNRGSGRRRPRSRVLSEDGLDGIDATQLPRAQTDGGIAIVSRLENEQQLFSERMSLLVRQIRSLLGEDEEDEVDNELVFDVPGVTFEDAGELDRLEAEEGLDVSGGNGPFFGGGDVGDFDQEWDPGQRDTLTPLTPGTDRSDVRGSSCGGVKRSKSAGSDWSALSSGRRAQSADSDMAVVPRNYDRSRGTSFDMQEDSGTDVPLEAVLASQVEMSESVLILLQQLQDMQTIKEDGNNGVRKASKPSSIPRDSRSEGRPYTSPAQMSRPAHRTSLDTVPVPDHVRANSRGGTSEILFIVDSPFGPDGKYDESHGSDWRIIEATEKTDNFRSGGGLYSRTMFPKLSVLAALFDAKQEVDETLNDATMLDQSISMAHNPTLGALDKSASSVRPLFGLPQMHSAHAAQLLPEGVGQALDPSSHPNDIAAAAAARALFADETTLISERGLMEVSTFGQDDRTKWQYNVEPETGEGLWWTESKATTIDTKLDLSSIVAYRERKEGALPVEPQENATTEKEALLDTARSAAAAEAAKSAALASAGLIEDSLTVRLSNDAKVETQKLLLTTAKRAQTFIDLLAVVNGLKLKPTTASLQRREKYEKEMAKLEEQGALPKTTLLETGTEHRGLTVIKALPLSRLGVRELYEATGQLVISKGEISEFVGDAIVNAADSACMGGGDPSIDGRIANVGGPDLLVARRQLPVLDMFTPPSGRNEEKKSPVAVRCPRGSAVLTIGGALEAKYVIHAVGPNYWEYEKSRELEGRSRYEGGARASDQILSSAARSAISIARDAPLPKNEGGWGIQSLSAIQSVAVAPLSLGDGFRGPKRDIYTLVELQIRAIIEEIMGQGVSNGPYSALRELHLVSANDEEIEAMIMAAGKIHGEIVAFHTMRTRAAAAAAAAAKSTVVVDSEAEEIINGQRGIVRKSVAINTPVTAPKKEGKKKKKSQYVSPTEDEKKEENTALGPPKWTRKVVEITARVRTPKMMRLSMPRNMSPEMMTKIGAEIGKYGTINMAPVHLLEAKARAFTFLTHQMSRYECGLWLIKQGRVARGLPEEDTPEAMAEYEAKLEAMRPRTLLELAMDGVPSSKNDALKEVEDDIYADESVEGTISLMKGAESLDESSQNRSKTSTVRSMSDAEIEIVFRKYDRKQRGVLDTFELGAAIEELTGRKLAYKELAHVVRLYNFNDNTVSFDAFSLLVKERDWNADDLISQEDCYNIEFPNPTLGFRVRTVPERGVIVVNRIVESTNYSRIGLGDVVLAVNGAPLGWVQSHTELADAVRSLPRPVRLTFRRSLNSWTGLPDVQWSEAQLTELFQRYARAAKSDLPGAPFSEHLGADVGETSRRLQDFESIRNPPIEEWKPPVNLPGTKLTRKQLEEQAEAEAAAKAAAEKAAKEAEDAYGVVVTDWVMDVFCLEPVLSQIYGRSIPTVNISEMVLQLQNVDGGERAVLELSDFIYIARNLIVNDLHEGEPIEVGPGKLMPGGKLHPSPKALFIPWEIEPSIPPSPLVQQIEDGLYPQNNVQADLALINDKIEDHLGGGEKVRRSPPPEYYEVIFRAASLGFRICNAASQRTENIQKGQAEDPFDAPESVFLANSSETTEDLEDGEKYADDYHLPPEVLVKDVPDEDLAEFVGIADSVVAVNGAPLGLVTDHKVLAARIRALPRPIRITFRRNNPEIGMRAFWFGNANKAILKQSNDANFADEFDLHSLDSIESSQLGDHEDATWHKGDP